MGKRDVPMIKNKKTTKMELLAPAGGKEQFIAAVENGADAIYMGGSSFNARIGAENFTIKDMEEAVDYGHLRGVNTYITMNTLMDDSSLPFAMKQVDKLYRIGVDAIIIQDLGLGELIKRQFPKMPLHFSTQGTVYNSLGAREIKNLGYERVVLAREMTLKEIQECASENIETEVFIHGALCFCYSGQCQLSRYMGGRSGNKGVCAQPCRLLYNNEKGESIYALSPKDLSLIDYLKELSDIGVTSLKIEGRMKSPQYVATVVGIYRKYLDALEKNGNYKVSSSDREKLAQVFNRGSFTEAHIEGRLKQSIFSGEIAKNQGIYVGEIISKKHNKGLCDAHLSKSINIGDILEIRGGKNSTSFMLTYLNKKERKNFTIGDIKDNVNVGNKIYRIISKELKDEAEATYKNIELNQGKFHKKNPVQMEAFAYLGCNPSIKIKALGLETSYEDKNFIIGKAEKPWDDKEEYINRIKEQLSKTGNTPFLVDDVKKNIKINCNEDIYLPIKVINGLRREAIKKLSEEIKNKYKRIVPKSEEKAFKEKENEYCTPHGIELRYNDLDDLFKEGEHLLKNLEKEQLKEKIIAWALPLRSLMKNLQQLEKYPFVDKGKVIPYIPNITEGEMDRWLLENRESILDFVKKFSGKMYIGSLSHLAIFRGEDVEILFDYGLNAYNEETVKLYKSLGMKYGVPSLEGEDLRQGYAPLMTTKWAIKSKKLVDRKGQSFNVIYDEDTGKTNIVALNKKFDIDKIKERLNREQGIIRVYT